MMQFTSLYISEQNQEKKRTEKLKYYLDEKGKKWWIYQMDFEKQSNVFSCEH